MQLHDHKQIHVPEHDDGKVMIQVGGLLGLCVIEQITRVQHHCNEHGAKPEHERAKVVKLHERQPILIERGQSSAGGHQTRQPNELPHLRLGHLGKLKAGRVGQQHLVAKVEHHLHDNQYG